MSAQSTGNSRLGLKLGISALILIAAGVIAWRLTRPVAQVVLVVRGKAVEAKPGSVTVEPEFFVQLTSEIGGRVIKSDLDEGKRVEKGDFLVQLDPSDINLKIEQQKNDIDTLTKKIAVGSQLQLQLESAKADLVKNEHLLQLGQVAAGDVENMRRSVKVIEQQVALEKVDNESQLKTLQNQLEVLELQRARMTITAPFAGVVKDVVMHEGALVGVDSPVATLIANSRSVEAHISEEDFAGIDANMHQKASVRFLTYGDQLYGASVNRVLPTADPLTQRYIVYLDVDLPPEKLTPGLSGEVNIVTGERDNALIVPRRALNGHELYVVEDGRVQLRTVKLGFVSLTEVEILQGVNEGDAVIVQDLDKFYDGERVRTEVMPK
jgi:RND family efflux transporter MFP subunit